MIQNELDIRLKPAIKSTSSTKVPLNGEIVLVQDTNNSANNNIRIGNGSTAISSLPNFLTMGGQGGGGTVTSVRVQATSPVQSSEGSAQSTTLDTTISLADAYGDTKNPYGSKTANYVLAAPNGSNGTPSFRALVADDIPNLFAPGGTSEGNLTTSSLKYYPTVKGGVDNSGISYLKALSLFDGEQSYRTVYFRGDSAAPLKMFDGTGNLVLNQIITSDGVITAPNGNDDANKYLKWTGSTFSWGNPSSGSSTTVNVVSNSGLTATTSGNTVTLDLNVSSNSNGKGSLITTADTVPSSVYINTDGTIAIPIFYGNGTSDVYTYEDGSYKGQTQTFTGHYINLCDVIGSLIQPENEAILRQLKEALDKLK